MDKIKASNNYRRWTENEKNLVQTTISSAIMLNGTKSRVIRDQVKILAGHLGRTEKGVRFVWNDIERHRRDQVQTATNNVTVSPAKLTRAGKQIKSVGSIDLAASVNKCLNAITNIEKMGLNQDELTAVFKYLRG